MRFRRHTASHQGGFTLVESLMVVVVLAIAGTAIFAMQGNLFSRQSNVSTVQIQSQLQMECAEQIMAVRKYQSDGYGTVATSSAYGTHACGGITALAGFTNPASVTVMDYTGGTGCPSGMGCLLVSISQDGATPLTMMFVDY